MEYDASVAGPVAVTGASGFVAKNLRRHLSSCGFRLYGVSRRDFGPLRGEKTIVTDYADPRKLGARLRGCDVLVHLAGKGSPDRRDGPSYADVNVSVTSSVVKAAGYAGIRRIVFLSGLGVSPANTSEYFASKLRAERVVRDSGIGFTIFRPSFIVGIDDYLTRLLATQARKGTVIVPGNGDCVLRPIRVEDAVRIIHESFTSKRFLCRTFDLVGPEPVSFWRYAGMFCAGKSARRRKVPLDECLGGALNDRRFPYSLDDLHIFYGGWMGDFGRLQRAFGAPIRSAVGTA